MHVEQINFDRVFDVQELTGSFSFERAGWPVYGVSAPGLGIPRAGSTYAVAFAETGNWQTVLGWRDLSTSTVRLRESTWQFGIRHLPYLYLAAPVPVGIAMAVGGYWAAAPLLASILLVYAAVVRHVAWRNRWLRQSLQVGRAALGPSMPSGWRAGLMWALAPLVFWN